MPIYQYACNECGHDYAMSMSIEEQGKAKIQCPKCKSQDVTQRIEAVFVRTSRKS